MSKTRASRIYLVRDTQTSLDALAETKELLVRAKTKAGAVALVASAIFKAELCSQEDLMRLAAKGETVMDAIESDE